MRLLSVGGMYLCGSCGWAVSAKPYKFPEKTAVVECMNERCADRGRPHLLPVLEIEMAPAKEKS